MVRKVLTIAGSDSCGGAGVQADLKTFEALGVYGMSVITAVTAQNTQGVKDYEDVSPELIKKQIEAVFEDIAVDAVKIGMVSRRDTIEVIREGLLKYEAENVVLDPVMFSTSGHELSRRGAKEALIEGLLPLAKVVTPNIFEAQAMADIEISTGEDMKKATGIIHKMGVGNVLVKGGHLQGDEAMDVFFDGNDFSYLYHRKIKTKNTHGTGCTLSSAIASYLAKGFAVYEAVASAKEYVSAAIEHSFAIGKGAGPVNHMYKFYGDESRSRKEGSKNG